MSETWTKASESIINPEPQARRWTLVASVAAGRELYYGAKANCVKCHGPGELGDGQTNDYDDWTKPLVEMAKSIASERESLDTNADLDSTQRAQRSRPGWP